MGYNVIKGNNEYPIPATPDTLRLKEKAKEILLPLYLQFAKDMKDLGYGDEECLSAIEIGDSIKPGSVLFYGRARNGYNTSWDDIKGQFEGNPDTCRKIIKSNQHSIWSTPSWIEDTQRSAFCRLVKKVATSLFETDWTNQIATSNLYKLTWYDSGNPSNKMCNDQYASCIEIFKAEISVLKPRAMVLVVDTWANDFLMDLGLDIAECDTMQWIATKKGAVSTIKMYSYKGISFIVTARPEGKSTSNLAAAILNIIKNK